MTKPSSKRQKTTSASSSDSKVPANSATEHIFQQIDPASATITVSAVEVPDLTEEEQSDRLHLERRVERAIFEAGKALTELRDRSQSMSRLSFQNQLPRKEIKNLKIKQGFPGTVG